MEAQGKQLDFIELVKAGNQYILVTAPAGTGKTFCCISSVKALCEINYFEKYQKALILTFSRNARAQLIKELSKIDSNHNIYKHIDISNYHSFFKRYLDSYRDLLGIKQKLNLLHDNDFLEYILKSAVEDGIVLKGNFSTNLLEDYTIIDDVLVKINPEAKNKSLSENKIKFFIKLCEKYTILSGNICFAQFGLLVCKLLGSSPKLVQALSHDYPIIILDEYQDTNYYQDEFIRAILKSSRGIFFADEFQMIYGFRGSTLKRITSLGSLFPGLKKIELDIIFRYRNKHDIIEILNNVRNKRTIDYSVLSNGKVIKIDVPCDSNWINLKGKLHTAQCTILSKYIFYKTKSLIVEMLKNNQSIALLCWRNDLASKIAKVFQENKIYPKTIDDNASMQMLNKMLKSCISPKTIAEIIGVLLCIALSCTTSQEFEKESIEQIIFYDSKIISRKRKALFVEIKQLANPLYSSESLFDKWSLIKLILHKLEESNYQINYAKVRYLNHCISIGDKISEEEIDNILLQQQYINSYTNIKPGLYITTIHQSKGKEFDSVFVIDVESIFSDHNLLYVSHSRMKKDLYPVFINYTGKDF